MCVCVYVGRSPPHEASFAVFHPVVHGDQDARLRHGLGGGPGLRCHSCCFLVLLSGSARGHFHCGSLSRNAGSTFLQVPQGKCAHKVVLAYPLPYPAPFLMGALLSAWQCFLGTLCLPAAAAAAVFLASLSPCLGGTPPL